MSVCWFADASGISAVLLLLHQALFLWLLRMAEGGARVGPSADSEHVHLEGTLLYINRYWSEYAEVFKHDGK